MRYRIYGEKAVSHDKIMYCMYSWLEFCTSEQYSQNVTHVSFIYSFGFLLFLWFAFLKHKLNKGEVNFPINCGGHAHPCMWLHLVSFSLYRSPKCLHADREFLFSPNNHNHNKMMGSWNNVPLEHMNCFIQRIL